MLATLLQLPYLPELFLLVWIGIVLLGDLFTDELRRERTLALTLLGVVITAVLIVVGRGDRTHAFNGMFIDDPMAEVLKLLVCIAVVVSLVYARGYIALRGLFHGEFFVLVLFAMLGMMVMISAGSLLTIYLGLELLSLSLYALVALQRDAVAPVEAAMKYFVLGALASGMLLYGMSMIYGATHSLDIARIAAAVEGGKADRALLLFGVVFLVAGIAFKLGTVPFHMWVPDVYHGAPTAVTLMLGTAPKLAAFAMLMRLLAIGLGGLAVEWQQMLMLLAVASLVVGNLAAIAQTNIKRVLAYSTISHMGFMLLGALSGVVGDSASGAAAAYSAAMFYVAIYVVTTLGAFGGILLLTRRGFEADLLDDFKGLNRRSPWFAFLMLLFMFSLAGVPPTAGFFAKLAVLQAVVSAGQLWLAVVAVLASLVGAFYYLRVVKLMYFDDPDEQAPISAEFDLRFILSANGVLVLILGMWPNALMRSLLEAVRGSL